MPSVAARRRRCIVSVAPWAIAALVLAAAAPARAERVADAFPPPEGATRVPTDAFGAHLRGLALRGAEVPVRTHAGAVVGHDARVIDLPLVKGDLQQCADSILRVRAEWLRATGAVSALTFRATSGDPIPWARYRDGGRPRAQGSGLTWVDGGAPGSWDGWLSAVFTWAGTRSLAAYETVPVGAPRAGDVVVVGGSPGHAVLLLDVAVRGAETFVLVGEGFMPAQDFHVERGPVAGWWPWTAAGLALPHWPMPASGLRRFPPL
jgi:hypothetical protein